MDISYLCDIYMTNNDNLLRLIYIKIFIKYLFNTFFTYIK